MMLVSFDPTPDLPVPTQRSDFDPPHHSICSLADTVPVRPLVSVVDLSLGLLEQRVDAAHWYVKMYRYHWALTRRNLISKSRSPVSVAQYLTPGERQDRMMDDDGYVLTGSDRETMTQPKRRCWR